MDIRIIILMALSVSIITLLYFSLSKNILINIFFANV